MLLASLALLLTIRASSSSSSIDYISFLKQYGYVETNGNQLSSTSMSDAIAKMQEYAAIPVTGRIDERTKFMMRTPRCGRPDVERRSKRSINEKYFKWNKKVVTYGSHGGSNKITVDNLRRASRQAAQQWSSLADIELVETHYDAAMIKISVGRYNHLPCIYTFNSQTLAHAFLPPDGQIHMNEDAPFVMTNYTLSHREHSLYAVVAHEMGHALGFHHSPDENSIMFAYDTPRVWQFTAEDKRMMQYYYGTKQVEQETTTTTTTTSTAAPSSPNGPEIEVDHILPDPCWTENPLVVFYRNEYLFFKSQWIWRVSSSLDRIIMKPTPISRVFQGVPSPIDACVVVEHNLWLFVADRVYVVDGDRLIHAPLRLHDFGINEPYIDLAYEWKYFKPPAIYLWKGNRYWRLDESMRYRRIDERYPKPIEFNWNRVPKGVQSAFTKDEEIHFLKDNLVYRMNSSRAIFDVADNYPKPLQQFFKFCTYSSRDHYKSTSNETSIIVLILTLLFIY